MNSYYLLILQLYRKSNCACTQETIANYAILKNLPTFSVLLCNAFKER